jgi:hypothetical protein
MGLGMDGDPSSETDVNWEISSIRIKMIRVRDDAEGPGDSVKKRFE